MHTDEYPVPRDLLFYFVNSRSIFIVMLHLYGTHRDIKIWAEIISAHAEEFSNMEVSVTEERWVGQKGNSEQTYWGMNA